MDVFCAGCCERDARLAELEAQVAKLTEEIAHLKGEKTKPRSNSKPSGLEKPPDTDSSSAGKRPGSDKRSKTQELTIHKEIPVVPKDLPAGSTLKAREAFVVQDLHIEAQNTRYLIEVWETPTGELRRGELPPGIRGHFGPGLIGFVLQQYHEAKVTQPGLLEELHDFDFDISAGQIHNLLTAQYEEFHAEKDELLATGLRVSSYVNVDDSGAPHQGCYGSCLNIGNEFFTTFHSSATKSRIKFLEVLRCGQNDYILNDVAWSYLKEQKLPAKVLQHLQEHPQRVFADAAAWQQHLDNLAIAASYRETVTEAALLGSVVEHGVSIDLGIISDGAATYALFVHALCWIHQERNLRKLVPHGAEQQQALEEVLTGIWQLYQDLKAYRAAPSPSQVAVLTAAFDALVGRVTCFPELNAALQRMHSHKDALLRVLERPDLPLHNNTAERDFRDWAKKRKISAGTRSDLGKRCRDTFMSLKGTCKKLGIRFYTYLKDRLLKARGIPKLPELVRQKAAASVNP